MASELPSRIDHDAPVFVISVAAQLAGMHPQTLRTYDRMGLVRPGVRPSAAAATPRGTSRSFGWCSG